VGRRERCPRCAPRARRLRQAATLALTAGLAVALSFGLARGGPLLAGLLGPSAPPRSPQEVEATLRLARLEADAKRAPCDKQATLVWVQALAQARQHRAAVDGAEAFLARCETAPALRAAAYASRMQLGEAPAAVRDAEALLAHAPKNTTYRMWRAQALEAAGDGEAALADYASLFEARPEQAHLALAYAGAQERLQRPCEAAATLQAHARAAPAAAGPGAAQTRAQVQARLAQLLATADCTPAPAKGQRR
jgi:predicted Zn-dependent protease